MDVRRVVVHSAGSYDRLKLEQHPVPEPGRGEVRVAARAIGVNYADCIVRMGLYSSAKEYVGWPITPGFELSGVVDAVGEGVTRVRPGDRVLALTRFGAYASAVVTQERLVWPLPERFGFEEAAGIPAVFLTAWYALCELAHPRPGQRLLVHSAAGGVGGALLQLAKVLGCEAVGVVGASHKVEAARRFGAAHVIDKSAQDLWAEAERLAPSGYDVVLDANGVSTLRQSYAHLARPGKLVVYGFHSMMPKQGGRPSWLKLAKDWLETPRFNPLDLTTASASVLAFNLSYLFELDALIQHAMRELLGWFADGKLTPPPVKTFALDAVADAHRAIESGQTVGKLVLVP